MDFHPPKFRALLLVMAITAMVLSANGQQSGQSIIFSSPQADDAQPAAPVLHLRDERVDGLRAER